MSPQPGSLESPTSMRYVSVLMGFHFCGSVLLVWLNKIAYNEGYRWTLLLTALSSLFAYVALDLVARHGVLQRQSVPLTESLPLSLALCGFVISNDFALRYNDPGVYELVKVLVTLGIVLAQSYLCSVAQSPGEGLTLLAMAIGMTLTMVSSFNFNFLGSLWAVILVTCTSFYQVRIHSSLVGRKYNPSQLLRDQSLWSFPMLFVMTFLLEDASELMGYTPSLSAISLIFIMCLLTLAVNLSIYLILSETLPISYNVLCNGEVCLLISLGYIFFGDPLTIKSIVGVVVTIPTLVWYTRLRLAKAQSNDNTPVARKSKSASEVDPFDIELDGI
ncbi:hypothetical protein FOL47_009539 [Perkinsus chesapeaki]|uniref:Sugar phosphate transporter domain-containing protein n=1 Tax=Perkinsus chesapeaki TaxID=330153 RepID=A0A7J6L7M2_PERCH|nr:hypothetical protein FOL47_009539 [Perkinsus chesapeaki]